MTVVRCVLYIPTANGDMLADGSLEWVPFGAPRTGSTQSLGTAEVAPQGFTVSIGGAVGAPTSITLDPTDGTWCWKVTEHITGGRVRYVQIPASGTVDYGALVDVDPTTLQTTTTASAAFAAALAAQAALASATYATVVSLGTTSGTDDTAAINAALVTGAGKVVRGVPGQSYKISAPLRVYIGTTLDMTGCTVTLNAGSNCSMLMNNSNIVGSGTDTDITVKGGTWARGTVAGTGDNNTLHSLYFQRVTGLKVTDLTYTSTSGNKYGILVYACQNFEVGNITFAACSDGVHVTGTAKNGWIHDIFGVTGDDTVALASIDYSAYNNGDLGDMSDIVVERVHTVNTGGNLVKVIAGSITGTPTYLRNIVVRDIAGTAGGSSKGLYLGGDPTEAGTYGGVIENFRGENIKNAGTNSAVLVYYSTLRGVTLANIISPTSYAYSIDFSDGATVEDITIRDCYFSPVAGCYAINMHNSVPYPVVSSMRLFNCRLNVATQSAGLVSQPANATLTDLYVTNLRVDRAAWAIGDFGKSLNLYLDGISAGSINGWFIAENGVTVDVKGATGMAGATNFGQSGTGKAASRALGFLCDVSLVAKNAGDLAYNTNGALSCGAGPVICNGTLWKHLYTGATY